jgi:putative acetyltransferase
MTPMIDMREDDLSGAQIQQLLALHVASMHEHSPPGSVHALDLSGLQTPDITVWTAWSNDQLLGCGALKQLTAKQGEIKSMRTDPQYLRQGVASAILAHIISVARSRGYARLSLETGSGASFEPALLLYRTRGFKNGETFGAYVATDFNQFLHLDL